MNLSMLDHLFLLASPHNSFTHHSSLCTQQYTLLKISGSNKLVYIFKFKTPLYLSHLVVIDLSVVLTQGIAIKITVMGVVNSS